MYTTLSKKDFSRYLPFLLLVMTVFRILAGLRIPYMILANQRYDDRLLFENAYDLLSGVWLGSYDSYTLAKGIGYPLFLEKAVPSLLCSAVAVAGGRCMAVCPRSVCEMAESLWAGNSLSAPVVFPHQPHAVGHAAAVPHGNRSGNGPGGIFQHDRADSAQRAPLDKTAALGIPDRTDSCLFLADPGGFCLDPAVYRRYDGMERGLCNSGPA